MEKENLKLLKDNAFSYGISKLAIQIITNKIQTIMIGSFKPLEGKTAITENLAFMLKSMHKRTFVFSIRSVENKEISQNNLMNILEGEDPLLELIDMTKDSIKIDYFNSDDLLSLILSERFTQMIEKLQESYDYVLFDVPSFNSEVNSFLIAKSLQNVILVIEENINSKYELNQLLKDFRQYNIDILGAVLNKAVSNTYTY